MRVSTRAEYGIRALIDLAMFEALGPVQTHDIARRQGLPEPYLNQILSALRRAGLVVSKRGPGGGHLLSRPPEEIYLADVFLALEGTPSPWECVDTSEANCAFALGCGLRPLWQRIKEATEHVLRTTTLADLLPRPAFPVGPSRDRNRHSTRA
ncbi:MAG: Rrf2 family transcriptional regulator [Armatimonadetes bacterium]|nr:Rrf2 family transcriptional regulator [Armatimonadota bacterium]MDW8154463.1 Rrf2 family transcriptional regulator [Armatimonadota bacterium]